MGVAEKLERQAPAKVGEPVIAAAMVVPPGATLYKSFSPSSYVRPHAGTIADAINSKREGGADGRAGEVPTEQGVLVVTETRVVFCKKRLLGVGCGDPIAEWPRESIRGSYSPPDSSSYPGTLLTFPDGSEVTVYGEKSWGLDRLAAALT